MHGERCMGEDGYMCMLSHLVMSNSVQPHDSSVHGILQGRILEWVAILFSRGSSRLRDQTQVSLGLISSISRRILYH